MAPMVALMISFTTPAPRWMFNFGSSQFPMNAPRIPDDDIADDAKAGALHDLASQPTGHEADDEDDEETFARHMHDQELQFAPAPRMNEREGEGARASEKSSRRDAGSFPRWFSRVPVYRLL